MNQHKEISNEYKSKWKYNRQKEKEKEKRKKEKKIKAKNWWNIFSELWLMKEKNIFEYFILKEFHVKCVKSSNKTCLIFNQDEIKLK
jgi:hypothetical protein